MDGEESVDPFNIAVLKILLNFIMEQHKDSENASLLIGKWGSISFLLLFSDWCKEAIENRLFKHFMNGKVDPFEFGVVILANSVNMYINT